MAERSRNQYIGAVGEVETVRALLDVGTSINSLTGSDHGWDLHLQLPEMPIWRIDAHTEPWQMSGRSLHVQCKRSESGNPPRIKLSTLRAWSAGATIGTPTFLFFSTPGDEEQRTAQLVYANPSDLKEIVSQHHGKDGGLRVDIQPDTMRTYEPRQFSIEIDLTSRYPRCGHVHATGQSIVDRVEVFEGAMRNLIIDLLAGWYSFFRFVTPAEAEHRRLAEDIERLLSCVRSGWTTEDVTSVASTILMDATRGAHSEWQHTGIYPGEYSSSQDPLAAFDELVSIIEHLAVLRRITRRGYDPGLLGLTLEMPDLADREARTVDRNRYSLGFLPDKDVAFVSSAALELGYCADHRADIEVWQDPGLHPQGSSAEVVLSGRGELDLMLLNSWGPEDGTSDVAHTLNCAPVSTRTGPILSLWNSIEKELMQSSSNGLLIAHTGPIWSDRDPLYKGVRIPLRFFKVVAWRSNEGKVCVTALLLDQTGPLREDLDEINGRGEAPMVWPDAPMVAGDTSTADWRLDQVPLSRVCAVSGLDLGTFVSHEVESMTDPSVARSSHPIRSISDILL